MMLGCCGRRALWYLGGSTVFCYIFLLKMVYMDLEERAALLVVFMGLALYNMISAHGVLVNHLSTQICWQNWCLDARVCQDYGAVL